MNYSSRESEGISLNSKLNLQIKRKKEKNNNKKNLIALPYWSNNLTGEEKRVAFKYSFLLMNIFHILLN